MRERAILALLRVARIREREAWEESRMLLAREADCRAGWRKASGERFRARERLFRAARGGVRGEELRFRSLWVERLSREEELARAQLREAERRAGEGLASYRERKREVRILELLQKRIRQREEERKRRAWARLLDDLALSRWAGERQW